MQYRWIWLLMCLLGVSGASAEAATRFAAPADVGAGNCTSTGNACDLQQAMNAAVAGDTVELASGTYTGLQYATAAAGTSGSKILMKAATLHGAILQGNNSPTDAANHGLIINHAYWIVEGLIIKNYRIAVWAHADNVEYRFNRFESLIRWGMYTIANSNNVHDNVFAKIAGTDANNDERGIALTAGSSNNTIKANWFYSIGNQRWLESVSPSGVAVEIYVGANDNLIQGNVFFDTDKSTAIRVFGDTTGTCLETPTPACAQTFRTIFRDNIVAFGQGGGIGIGENVTDSQVLNNVTYGVWYTGIGSKGNDPGRNIFKHNTVVATPFSLQGWEFFHTDIGVVDSKAAVVKDNLSYGPQLGNDDLFSISDHVGTFTGGEANFNLFWRAGPTSGWVDGYTYGANDIHATGSVPLFVNEATGDFRLATGSPGKGAASDNTDMGAIFDTNLRLDWMQALIAFSTPPENTTSGATSTSFTSLPTANQYQVWGYVDNSSPYTGSETVTIEGNGQTFNMGDVVAGWIAQAPQRYIYLGTYTHDGTLNVSWTSASSFDKIFIRRMPTPAEAYTLLTTTGDIIPPSAPTSLTLTVMTRSRIDLTIGAASDNVAVTAYLIERCSGAACTPIAHVTIGATPLTYSDTGLLSSTMYRYQAKARDDAMLVGPPSSPIQQATTLTCGPA